MAVVADVCVSIAWSGMACNMLLTDALWRSNLPVASASSFIPTGRRIKGNGR